MGSYICSESCFRSSPVYALFILMFMFQPYSPLSSREFLCPDIVIIDSRCVQCLPQRTHHFRWASDVVNRKRKITDVFASIALVRYPGSRSQCLPDRNTQSLPDPPFSSTQLSGVCAYFNGFSDGGGLHLRISDFQIRERYDNH